MNELKPSVLSKSFWSGAALSMAIVVFMTSCASVTTTRPKNLVAIDPDGSLRATQSTVTKSGHERLLRNPAPRHFSETNLYAEKSFRQLDAIFKNNPDLDSRAHILLFIQGGLNDVSDGAARASELSDRIMAKGIYPIFLAWDANLFSAWREQYTTHRGANDRVVGTLLAPFTFLANAGRLVTRVPLSAYEQADAGLRTMKAGSYGPPAPGVSAKTGRTAAVNVQYDHLKNAGFDVDLNPSADTTRLYGRGLGMLASASPKALAEGVVDTGGKVAWDFMLRRTKTMFTVANSFAPGGMDLFGRELRKYLQSHPNTRVTVVAHSMGAIVANEVIRRYGDDLQIANIVYMAAACSVEALDQVIIPFLRSHSSTKFYNLCLHPANDYSDLAFPILAPIAPRGSLLDWIDRYYSSTETDYGWTLGKWDNAILASKSYLRHPGARNLRSQIHIKAFGFGPPEAHGPQHHGGFDRWKFWEEKFWQTGPYDPSWRQGQILK
jgi:pimeloyl-ACP methyl ester carboxylesterase